MSGLAAGVTVLGCTGLGAAGGWFVALSKAPLDLGALDVFAAYIAVGAVVGAGVGLAVAA